MNYLSTFHSYTPTYIFGDAPVDADLKASYKKTGLIVCGELHGVKENADVLYSMIKLYGCETLAIERSKNEFGIFMDTVIAGVPDFTLVDEQSFFASMLSVEMCKAIYCLFDEGLLGDIQYIDTNDDHVEQGLADNLLELGHSKRTIAVMGNWHTVPEVDSHEGHISALVLARQERPITYVEYKYGSGKYYNEAVGTDTIETDPSINGYAVKRVDESNFILTIPMATEIGH